MNAETVIKAENISKQYRLGVIDSRTFAQDAVRWWHRKLGKEDPFNKVNLKNNEEQNTGAKYMWALKDINFEIKRGDAVGIIGKNGAGKSTLLKIISRITQPATGEIRIKGRVGSLLEVGTGFHPELTGRENVFMNGTILGMKKQEIKDKFDEIVAFSGVEKFIDTPVKRYSSGMYVRLAFSVAAHLEPEILIVDEVLSVGDAEFQKKCLEKMQDLRKKDGRTLLFVSHNIGAINSLCNSALLLNSGLLQGAGDTEKITGMYFSGSLSGVGEFIVGKNNLDEKVIIEKVTLRDSNGNAENNFKFAGNIEVEVELNSLFDFEKPYVWVAIKSSKGPITNASGLIDGYRSSGFTKGKNIIKCTFLTVPLLPGQYTIYMGIRDADGMNTLTESKDIAAFNITSSLSKIGLNNITADKLALDSASPIISYQWEFNDGKKYTFNIKNYVK
jgi:lipopolysaccharide transport system ATP-binding protein